MTPTIAISMGDYNGIGPEVLLKFLSRADLSLSIPVITGHHEVIEYYAGLFKLDLPIKPAGNFENLKPGNIYIHDVVKKESIEIHPGRLSKKAGKVSMKAVDNGISLCMQNICDALVTAPISKEAIHKAGYNVPGHTEFLADKTGTKDYMMIMAGGNLRVGLATVHIPVKKVAPLINENGLIRYLRILNESLKNDFSISSPEIAVLGLNPHAGDGGVIGDEEQTEIIPALQKANFNDINAKGPFAADSFFGKKMYENFDAILAMYHDQGLIPFKTLTFGSGVNFTAGLPIIRTSPDHGTAFDIAGLNRADDASFQAAYNLAVSMAVNRLKEIPG
ncbi:MAG: 4-hydroxythreonine-4-phosphate dehydrogenase PdxA [Balneolaceae bacterium]